MSRKQRRRRKPGNIKNDPAYNPFPKTGLVKQYEPYIRGVVGEFCKRYPDIRRDDFLYRAIELANAAEKTFKPELGFKFSTHLGGFARNGRLRELHRLHDKFEAEQGVEIYRTKEDLAHEAAEEAGDPTDAVNFAGGGNGVRLLFDLQWWEALLSDIVNYCSGRDVTLRKAKAPGIAEGESAVAPVAREGRKHQPAWRAQAADRFHQIVPLIWPTTKLRHRLKLGTQLRESDNALEVHGRISRDLPEVLGQQPPGSVLMGWIRAVIDHLIRRQREADDEGEKRQRGDYSPTFLEAERNVVDIKFYKGRRPPRFLPRWQPTARLDDAYSHQGEEDKTTLHDIIADGREAMAAEEERQKALADAAAIRPTLANKSDIDMLDALVARLRGDADGGLIDVAKEIGITKGAASKVAQRLKRAVGRK